MYTTVYFLCIYLVDMKLMNQYVQICGCVFFVPFLFVFVSVCFVFVVVNFCFVFVCFLFYFVLLSWLYIKGAWPDLKISPLYPLKIEILVSEESLCFSDYCSDILSLKCLHLDVMNKKVANFHTQRSHSLLWDSIIHIFSFSMKIKLYCTPFYSKFGIRLFERRASM